MQFGSTNVLNIEIIHNNRLFVLAVPVGTPFEDAYDVVKEYQRIIQEMMDKAKEEQAQKADKTEE